MRLKATILKINDALRKWDDLNWDTHLDNTDSELEIEKYIYFILS